MHRFSSRVSLAAFICALALQAQTRTAHATIATYNAPHVGRAVLSPELLSPLLRVGELFEIAPERTSEAPIEGAPTQWVMPERRLWTMVDGHPVVGTPRLDELWHTVEARHTLRWLETRYRVKQKQLAAWNPNIDLRSLEPGDVLLVWRRDEEKVSQGLGSPSRGRLRDGEPLPEASKYHILFQHRAFGTYYAVSEIKRVFDGYALAYPDAEKVMVGDLSWRTGRRIKPHVSHQTGRDVDITYPRTNLPPDYNRFHRIRRKELDAARTLWLVREFINSGTVEYIFMDRWVQRLVYKEAERQGAPQEWLDAVFEYPKYGGKALVRRAKGHDDHMHLRFYCQPTDRWCDLNSPVAANQPPNTPPAN